MALLRCLGSSSSGNAYVLECDGETLILELGLSWKEIIKGLGFNIANVSGCVVSHQHKDHSLSIPNALKASLSVYSCQEVQSIHPKVKVLEKGKKTPIGSFNVMPIPLQHSCECYGFLIEHQKIGRCVFCTDCNAIPYKFKNISHFFVESNYDNALLINNMCNDVYSRSASENHLEINDTIDFLKANYTSSLQTIVLLHLSGGNSNANGFKQRVQQELCFSNVLVADKGVEIDLNAYTF